MARAALVLIPVLLLVLMPACRMNERMSGAAIGAVSGGVIGGVAGILPGALIGVAAGGAAGYMVGDYIADRRESCEPPCPLPCDPCPPQQQPLYQQPDYCPPTCQTPPPACPPDPFQVPCVEPCVSTVATTGQAQRRAAEAWIARGRRARTAPEAQAAYAQALRIDPNPADAWNLLGLPQRAGGRHQEAKASFRRALAIDETHYGARQSLIYAGG